MNPPMNPPVPVGRGVSAWWLRVAVAVSGAAILGIPLLERPVVGLAVLVGLAVAGSVYAPASPAPAAAIVGAAVTVVLSGDDPLRPAVLAMIPAVHLFHVSCGLAGILPVHGRLHLVALRRPALRVLAVQGVTFVLAGVAAVLPTGRVPVVVEVFALVGLVVIALVALGPWREHAHTRGDGRSAGPGATMEAWGEGRRSGS
ncbi:hypothetical protein BLA60_13665 [Actinophytocola xinjiangensis]|uniref:Uncharacterized protein n=1 Tax=Actinophytocola xinjiangensis TaxID=485602 RepID=A0A7Z0WNH7_9PSEU|nr:hypothetical protein [Actinophytocola xinjiangensis]OLF11050.1 hypothetical protein BLA60_13665 [Actinophytocola xinjiangensis]